MRKTDYADEIASASVSWGNEEGRIERLFVKGTNQEEIRFSWWKDGNIVIRPLDLTEEDLLVLMKNALDNGVFTDEFKQKLKAML